jgi:hypothetical protein
MPTFEIDITKVPLFFQIFYLLVSKIEICLKYFLDKNLPKQPLWAALSASGPLWLFQSYEIKSPP